MANINPNPKRKESRGGGQSREGTIRIGQRPAWGSRRRHGPQLPLNVFKSGDKLRAVSQPTEMVIVEELVALPRDVPEAEGRGVPRWQVCRAGGPGLNTIGSFLDTCQEVTLRDFSP